MKQPGYKLVPIWNASIVGGDLIQYATGPAPKFRILIMYLHLLLLKKKAISCLKNSFYYNFLLLPANISIPVHSLTPKEFGHRKSRDCVALIPTPSSL